MCVTEVPGINANAEDRNRQVGVCLSVTIMRKKPTTARTGHTQRESESDDSQR